MKGISYELRDAVREAEANDAGPFMPSLSVRQSVDLEDGVMWAAHRRMVQAYGCSGAAGKARPSEYSAQRSGHRPAIISL
jgi:hypothetical protein